MISPHAEYHQYPQMSIFTSSSFHQRYGIRCWGIPSLPSPWQPFSSSHSSHFCQQQFFCKNMDIFPVRLRALPLSLWALLNYKGFVIVFGHLKQYWLKAWMNSTSRVARGPDDSCQGHFVFPLFTCFSLVYGKKEQQSVKHSRLEGI